jgi:DNA-binding MarR family transcriptional regulator
MVALIDELEQKGLRQARAEPRRPARVITLTSAGRRAQARAEKAIDAHALEFFGQLSEREREELHRLLARLVGHSE